jgi:acetyl-CoA carboxylase biotin carboxylase subunit
MIKKILIANRGEIALRIIRTCKEMGIKTVALCPQKGLESHFLETAFADEFYYLEREGAKGYLDIKRILEIAKKAKVDAIHPGYGFLSENWIFAKLCEKQKIKFIGPHYSVLKKLEDKMEAKKIAQRLKIPILPMSKESINSLKDLKKWIFLIRPPFVLKARKGGGGIGIRAVNGEITIGEIFTLALGVRKQMSVAFKDTEFFLEKYLPEAKHIEVQILGDGKNFLHLFERECSLQRRFQKLLEEAPSPSVDEKVREKLVSYALSFAKELKYETVGTFEFLLDKNQNLYFMEVNPRIQVEHPVTEAITGIDLVEHQIRVSQGEKIKMRQEDIKKEGWAIEARVCAENPFENFKPSPGRIEKLFLPGGQGIFVHTFLHEGQEIFPYFDSLIAKIISYGKTREEAISRLKRALKETVIEGIHTNLPFFETVLEEKEFLDGTYTTNFVESAKILEKLKAPQICKSFIFKKPEITEEEIAKFVWQIYQKVRQKSLEFNRETQSEEKISAWKKFHLIESMEE